MDSMKYPIKGIVLDEHDIIKIHEYYKQYSMAEYLNAVYKLPEKTAFEAATYVLNLVEHGNYVEADAIAEFLKENKKEETNNHEQN